MTVRIRNQALEVEDGHVGTLDLRVVADRDAWLGFVAGERSLVWALLRGKIRLQSSPRHLLAFGHFLPLEATDRVADLAIPFVRS